MCWLSIRGRGGFSWPTVPSHYEVDCNTKGNARTTAKHKAATLFAYTELPYQFLPEVLAKALEPPAQDLFFISLCPGFAWDRDNFLSRSWCSVMLWIQ